MTNAKEQNIITFDEGLFGFEDCKKFIPVFFEDDSDSMFILNSLDVEGLSFVVMNPFMLKTDYKPQLDKEQLETLGKSEIEEYSWYVICVTKNPVEESTVNLKCPIVINPNSLKAKQVILDNQDYLLRHTLKELTRKENGSC